MVGPAGDTKPYLQSLPPPPPSFEIPTTAVYCNNNLLIGDINTIKIMKFYYFHTLKALWDGQGKIKVYYGIARFKEQLSGKSSSHMNFCEMLPVVIMKTKTKSP